MDLRAKLPKYGQIAALALLGVTLLAIVVGFYRGRNHNSFHLKPEHARLSNELTAEVNNYERLEADGNTRKYFIRADQARTFSDDHQELDNVYIEVYGPDGAVDRLKGDSGLYVPEKDRNFTAYLKGDVAIETRDALKIRTSNIVYTKADETASADDYIEFERENIKGHAYGANVQVANKRLTLLRDVEVEMVSADNSNLGFDRAAFRGNTATYDQAADRLEVNGGIEVRLTGSNNGRNTLIRADRAVAVLAPAENGPQPALRTVELFDNVRIENSAAGSERSTMETAYAVYDKPADRFELKNGVHIIVGSDQPADIRAAEAVYLQTAGSMKLIGGAELSKGQSYVRGDVLLAKLSTDRRLKSANVSGSAYLANSSSERKTEINANELNADFDDAQHVQAANARGNVRAVITPTNDPVYTTLSLSTPGSLKASFLAGGLPSAMNTEGRSTVQLDAPNGSSDAANKRVVADTIKLSFNENGKDLKQAQAVGNAELYIEPLRALPENYKTTIYAPRFDCDFYPSGNSARQCTGGPNTRTVRVATMSGGDRGQQNLSADTLTAVFNANTKDVDTLRADGQVKFTELDRNAVASTMTFTQSDQLVRLRGGEPTFWDSSVRAKAPEIDWDTRSERSYLRGGVSTTYYSQKKTGDVTPFENSGKPVFATSQTMEIDHRSETAVFAGNARIWQDNNYVRADKLVVAQKQGTFDAEGDVQSLLYEARQPRKSSASTVPAYATASSLHYDRAGRVLNYRRSVDIRQGTDRVTAERADIYLNAKNEMVRSVMEGQVVITQPGRKATGDRAEYSGPDEVATIIGNPAKVEDGANGISQSGKITINLRDNRILSEGPTQQNPSARTRSVYKVRNTQ
jgi:LPS export ABC transporter protein LptC